MIWPLSPRILNTRLMSHTPVRLIFNQDMTQFQDTVDVFWGFDYSFIFEYRGDDGVGDGASGGEELLSQEGDVARDCEEGEDGLVRVYRCYQECR